MVSSALLSVTVLLAVAGTQVLAGQPSFFPVRSVLVEPKVNSDLVLETCDNVLTCPTTPDTVVFPYGTSQRKGSLKVVYNLGDGSINLQTGVQGPKTLKRTIIDVGGERRPDCIYVVDGPANIDRKIQFDQDCGFQQINQGDRLFRQFIVHVEQQFETSASSPGVHLYGARDITVKVYLTPKMDVDQLLVTPVVPQPDKEEIGSCSALNHILTIKAPYEDNQGLFTVTSDYSPSKFGVGFTIRSCVQRPYKQNSNDISMDPNHAIQFIRDGEVVGIRKGVIIHTIKGPNVIEYEYSIPRIMHGAGVTGDFNRTRAKVVECTVCLCRWVPVGSDPAPVATPLNTDLPLCTYPERKATKDDLTGLEEDFGTDVLEAGRVSVVEDDLAFLKRK